MGRVSAYVCVWQEERAVGGLLWQAFTHMALCNLSADDITERRGNTHVSFFTTFEGRSHQNILLLLTFMSI